MSPKTVSPPLKYLYKKHVPAGMLPCPGCCVDHGQTVRGPGKVWNASSQYLPPPYPVCPLCGGTGIESQLNDALASIMHVSFTVDQLTEIDNRLNAHIAALGGVDMLLAEIDERVKHIRRDIRREFLSGDARMMIDFLLKHCAPQQHEPYWRRHFGSPSTRTRDQALKSLATHARAFVRQQFPRSDSASQHIATIADIADLTDDRQRTQRLQLQIRVDQHERNTLNRRYETELDDTLRLRWAIAKLWRVHMPHKTFGHEVYDELVSSLEDASHVDSPTKAIRAYSIHTQLAEFRDMDCRWVQKLHELIMLHGRRQRDEAVYTYALEEAFGAFYMRCNGDASAPTISVITDPSARKAHQRTIALGTNGRLLVDRGVLQLDIMMIVTLLQDAIAIHADSPSNISHTPRALA